MTKYLIKTVGIGGSLNETCEDWEIKEKLQEIRNRIYPGNEIIGIYKDVTEYFGRRERE